MKKTLFKLNNSLQYCTARSILNEYHILTTHIDDMSKCLDKCCLFLNTSHTELNWLCIFTSEKCFKLKLVCFLFCLTVKSAITKKKQNATDWQMTLKCTSAQITNIFVKFHSIHMKTDEKWALKNYPIYRNG